MKGTAVLLTDILLMAGMLFIGGSCITKDKKDAAIPDSNILKEEVSSKEEKAVPAPQPAYKQEALPTATKSKLVKPHFNKIDVKGDSSPYCGAPPMREENDISDSIITCNLATEAEYPGGAAAWQRYLNKNMRFPEDSIDEEMQFSVVVKFVVDEEGNVSDAEAISGSKALGAEAVRVIKQSGKWIPAKQLGNGRFVKSFKKQPIIIHVEVEE
jgi:outer membrane biosynthesis protein TonB